MRVLQVMAGDSVGGAETFFVDSIKAFHETQHKQCVITRDNNKHKIAQIKERGIPYKTTSFSNVWPFSTAKVMRETIKEFEPDIIHHYMGRAGTFSQPGKHVNLGWYGGYYKPERFKHCQHHAAVTQDIVEHIIKQGVPKENAHLLHIYAEFAQGNEIDRSTLDTPDDAPLLVSLSRLHEKKGLDVLLEALVTVPDAYLWIAGSGPMEKQLKQQTKDLKLEERVRFLGWRNDQADLLATADVIAFPSRYEPFGAVVIEAWAGKKPLVTARAKGPAAYVRHEENGLIVDIDDVDALARALRRVIIDKQLCDAMVENGYRAYLENFTREVYKKNVTELYERILEKR